MAAIASINNTTKEIWIEAHIVFYGTHAEPILGQKIIAEINAMWNQPKAFISVNNEPYAIIFKVDFECQSNENVIESILNNQDFKNNFIRLEDKNNSERSMMGFGLGDNSGHWIITDNLGESTTAAHEFGHAMGLPHPDDLDYRNTGFPPIMAPRGTIVDAEYQWNPMAEPGTFGGTMQPRYRKVRFYEAQNILANASFDQNQKANIGRLTNILFDIIGNPSGLILQ